MRVSYWLVGAVALFGVWVLFAGAQVHELIVGIPAAALAAAGMEAVRGTEHPHFLPHLTALLRAAKLPGEILQDTALLIRNLLTGGDGRFVREPFEAGGDDARSVARRVLETTYRTLPPNSIVLGIDRQRNEILLHVLEGRA